MKKLLLIVGGSIAASLLVWAGGALTSDVLERPLVLALNPDSRMPVIDELVVLITDCSFAYLGLTFVFWEIGFQFFHRRWASAKTLATVFTVAGVGLGLYFGSTPFRREREFWTVYAALGPLIVLAMWLAGRTFSRWSASTMESTHRVFWTTVLALGLTLGAGEAIKNLAEFRPRPLSDSNAEWNHALRILQDERVRRGNAYVSGHASTFFALITPLFWTVRRRDVKLALLGWAVVLAYTRVYVAAHYPYDALMGSLLGFAIATLVTRLLHVPEE